MRKGCRVRFGRSSSPANDPRSVGIELECVVCPGNRIWVLVRKPSDAISARGNQNAEHTALRHLGDALELGYTGCDRWNLEKNRGSPCRD